MWMTVFAYPQNECILIEKKIFKCEHKLSFIRPDLFGLFLMLSFRKGWLVDFFLHHLVSAKTCPKWKFRLDRHQFFFQNIFPSWKQKTTSNEDNFDFSDFFSKLFIKFSKFLFLFSKVEKKRLGSGGFRD